MNILQLINIAQILAGIAYALYTMCRNYIQLNQRMRAQAVRKPKYVAGFQAAHGYALPSPTRASWLPMLAWGSHIIVIYMCGLPCWPRTPQCESSVCLSYMRGFWKATMFTPLLWASWQPMLMCRSPFVCIARRGLLIVHIPFATVGVLAAPADVAYTPPQTRASSPPTLT
ncbi:hypothetical protein PLEOSDRAFT_1081582 [Pleurotus ostreatus PC15]|uniref:Uncharacterized protein n=1 Tax=Pleurotus ostreatus (strain PC15) TaxID=1137138 RepID=A0A067P7P4_PLEO1|nr:hypothetical protein PLEOSDRAFT_1081582 [Pleurotus ostreatus PC15]